MCFDYLRESFQDSLFFIFFAKIHIEYETKFLQLKILQG